MKIKPIIITDMPIKKPSLYDYDHDGCYRKYYMPEPSYVYCPYVPFFTTTSSKITNQYKEQKPKE